jgi:hypothetical protein
VDIEFDCDNLKHDTGWHDDDVKLYLEVGFYDETLDCESEIGTYLTKDDAIQIAKNLGVTAEDLV